jgi:perosamine synthetase
MIPRGQIDIGWGDLAAGLLRCAWPGGRMRMQQEVERLWDADGRAVATLSVRSGLDLVLRALALPPGSEVLVSAITIRDMVTVLEAHELVVVPVPVDMDRLVVPADALAAAVTPRTRAVLVAHLFGSRMPMEPLVSFARERGLLLLEDCAQAYNGNDYRGADGADVSMFSFGPIKTNTALGGALLRFRDREVASRVRSLQREFPVQRRCAFGSRVAKYIGIRALLHRAAFSAFAWGCRMAGVSHDEVIARSVRGFAGRELIPALRHQPSYPLLALVRRRLCGFRPARLEGRVEVARALRGATAHLRAPGDAADRHTHWVVPVWVEEPEQVARSLRRRGLDATQGASSLHAIPPRTDGRGGVYRAGSEGASTGSTDPMSSVLYLPCHPSLSQRDLARLRVALRGVRSPGGKGVRARSAEMRNSCPPTDSGLSGRPGIGSLASRSWDLVVVGGGITGAAVFREAACRGARVLLVERGDFASGTSSRSSKLVHGGLHYLARGHLRLALESVRERNRLLRERPDLVTPLSFEILPGERGTRPSPLALGTIIAGYRLLAGSEPKTPQWSDGAQGRVHRYHDAQTDDARMVLQLLLEGGKAGGVAVNYVQVTEMARDGSERVVGCRVQDRETGASGVVRARIVVNATGPRAGLLAGKRSAGLRVRGIRGSHLVLPHARLPIPHAVGTTRPGTRDWVCFIPWNGVVLVGSTSVDVSGAAPLDPAATEDEVLVLLSDVQRVFPDRGVTLADVQATFAGVRPVVDTETADPALASREEAILEADGMITVTGGKFTTHQATAKRVLDRCMRRIPGLASDRTGEPPGPKATDVPRTIQGRVRDMVVFEGVRHLDDLLLRRLRWGITRPDGGFSDLPSLRRVIEPALGWDDHRWTVEMRRYQEELERTYRLPHGMGGGRGLERAVRAANLGNGIRSELGRAAAAR